MNWYQSEDKSKSVREVVLDIKSPIAINPKFGMMMLGTKYHMLRSNVWIAGYFRIDGDPGPYLMVRADGHTEKLRNQSLRVAHCYYRTLSGGLYAIFVDFPAIKVSGIPSDPFVLFEMIRGIDLEDEKLRILDGINKERLHLCFCEGDGPGEDLGGGIWSGGPINAQYDVVVDVPPECRKVMKVEWEELLRYHHKLSPSSRSFNDSVRQMQSENPLTLNPILERVR